MNRINKILSVLIVALFGVTAASIPLSLGLLGVAIVTTSCSGSGTITQTDANWDSGSTDLSNQRLVNIVAQKHDDYVNADPSLTPEDKSAYLAESMVVRMAFTVKSVNIAAIRTPMNNVLTRHDSYVNGDPDISVSMKDALLFSSANIRRTIAEGR